MIVELREHIGTNIATGKPQKLSHYRVFVDGASVGFIGWHPGAKLLLTTRFGPLEREKIEGSVIDQLKRMVHSEMMPDVPAEVLSPKQDEGIDLDDFDQS